jgi:uncharacterized protein YneF (UPF0154 family)
MCALLKDDHGWTVHKIQNPSGAHVCITMNIVNHWQKFVDAIKQSTQKMKKNPELNTNEDTALYGMTGSIPDKKLIHQFVSIH